MFPPRRAIAIGYLQQSTEDNRTGNAEARSRASSTRYSEMREGAAILRISLRSIRAMNSILVLRSGA
jgi:hypothetical protein